MNTSSTPPANARHRVHRAADRGHYDRTTIHQIIDASYLCHVSWLDGDNVLCIPTACWRIADHLYIHGSNGSRMMTCLAQGLQACVAITHLDGLVLAKSAFAHSMNYRSVVVHGQFSVVPDEDKPEVLQALVAWIAPGRENEVRPPDANELQATTVLALPLVEAAAKIRNWGPKDKEQDLLIDAWAGVLPMRNQAQPATHIDERVPEPAYIQEWSKQQFIRN